MTESGLLGARYELGEVIGHGGMAEVRQGHDTRLGRQVAVKTLRTDLATDPTFQARFRREAQSAASLNHPSIVAVYDTGEQVLNGVAVPYIVMEYVEGRTLRDVLREGRRLLPERALEITADVLEALEYSHRAGIVHRDIKPANVMLTPAGDVKVMDFGIARAIADTSGTMTQTAAVIGTAQYLSPEQARGDSVDARSDIYSTGCLLYELLTHTPPFTGDSPVSVAYQHVREEPRPPSMVDTEISPEADAITLKALAKRPADRYQSAAEMRADIDRALGGQAVAAPVVPVDATARYLPASDTPDGADEDAEAAEEEAARRRRKKWYVALAILGVLAIIALAWLLVTVFAPEGGDDLPVPQLTQMSEAEATDRLRQQGFTEDPRVEQTSNADVESGVVFEQDPAQGEFVPEDTIFTLTVSTGAPETTVPDVMGQHVDDAEQVLRNQEFEVARRPDPESTEPANTVTAVSPEVGEEVALGTTVTLTFSTGLVEVPDVTGETQSVAEATLRSQGFDVAVETQETEDAEPGQVVRQVPTEGERLEEGATVTIFVAEAPPPPPEPDPEPTTETPPPDDETPPPDEETPPPDEETPPPEDEDPPLPIP